MARIVRNVAAIIWKLNPSEYLLGLDGIFNNEFFFAEAFHLQLRLLQKACKPECMLYFEREFSTFPERSIEDLVNVDTETVSKWEKERARTDFVIYLKDEILDTRVVRGRAIPVELKRLP